MTRTTPAMPFLARRLARSEHGATAIEYAIIVALIGVGLIGSLVSTRTSISSIFGVASSQMSSANTGATPGLSVPVVPQRAVTPASSSGRAPFWNGKSLSDKAVTYSTDGTAKSTTYTYADNTKAVYTERYGADGKIVGEQTTIFNTLSANDALTFNYGPSGETLSMVYNVTYADGTSARATSSAAGNWAENVKYYNASGALTSDVNSWNTAQGVLNNAAADEVYFRATSNL